MALITGVSAGGVQFVAGNATGVSASRHTYLFNYNFGVNVGGTDTATVLGLGAAVGVSTRSGKTYTLRDALCTYPGVDSAGVLVYTTAALVVSGDNLTFSLANTSGGTQSSAATIGPVGILACFDVT